MLKPLLRGRHELVEEPPNAMIVKCEQCQTRFKIPDERVTDKGVKVRCTKCQHMFRVTRDMAQPAAATASPAARAPVAPLTMPVPPPPPPPGPEADPFAMAAPARAPESDPFARFGAASDASARDETREGVFALGVEASKVLDRTIAPPSPIKPAPPSSKPFDFSTLAPTAPISAPSVAPPRSAPRPPPPAAAAPAPFDFGGLTSEPSPPSPKVSPGPSPFDFSALGPASSQPNPGAPSGGAFDFGTLGPSTALPPPPASAPSSSKPAPPAFDFSAMAPSPQAATTKVAAFEPSFDDVPPPPSAPQGPLFADVPDLNEPLAESSMISPTNVPDDFFGTPLAPPPSAPRGAGSYRGGAGIKEELFEMPAPASEAVAAPDPSAPRPQVSVPVAVAIAAPKAPDTLVAAEAGARRNALGWVINLGIAVLLVAALIIVGSALLNEGKLDASSFSAARLKSLVSRETDFEASDISNGLYDTLRGKPVFFVRGEVTNHGSTPTRVRIRAEILDGETMVRAAEVVAGTPPTPEQLRNLTGADEVERLLTAVSKTAPSVAPGETAPFLVTFFEYPPDLKAFRVRVSARPEQGETAER